MSRLKVSSLIRMDLSRLFKKRRLKMNNGIFIHGNVPSSKNSKVWTGKMLVSSGLVYRYKKHTFIQFEAHRNKFIKAAAKKSLPLFVKFTFFRETHQRFDFNNISQIVCDMMVLCKWIEDDSYKFLVPVFNPEVIIDKNNPGVKIEIL